MPLQQLAELQMTLQQHGSSRWVASTLISVGLDDGLDCTAKAAWDSKLLYVAASTPYSTE
jgi:hypothetical protein